MKFVMVLPPSPWLMSDRDQPLTGALYIVAALKSYGYEVQVCDLAGLPEDYWHIPVGDVYGVTGTTPHFPYMRKIIEKLKIRNPDCIVIVGGVHATVAYEHVYAKTKADACVIGEGEDIIISMMWEIEKYGKLQQKVYFSENHLTLDRLPFPDRASIDYYDYLIPQTYKYLVSNNSVRETSVITGRGCPYQCSYCASNKIYKGNVRFRTAYNVFYELKGLKDTYDIGLCNFIDDTFILDTKRVAEICYYIKPLGIKWFFLTRVDRVDAGLFEKMRDAGCISVTFGFESGSDRILKAIKKNTTVKQAYEAIDIAKKAGFKIRGQLMVGLPFEEDEDVEATAAFIRKADKVDTFGLHVFQPYPGSDVWEYPWKYNWKIDKDTDFSDYHTIGKPNAQLTRDTIVWNRFGYLKSVIDKRSIDLL